MFAQKDPSHKAYRRRVKNGAGSIARPSPFASSSSRSSSYMSPFATGYLAAADALVGLKVFFGSVDRSSGTFLHTIGIFSGVLIGFSDLHSNKLREVRIAKNSLVEKSSEQIFVRMRGSTQVI